MKMSESRFSQCLYFASNALARKVEKLAIESWKPFNLSPSHGYLLMAILAEPGIQPGQLAQEMQLTPSTITRLIEKLEENKWVVRTTEGKITNVYPTPKAKEHGPQFKACVNEFYTRYSSILGCREVDGFVQQIGEVADQL
jgi:DNA-binding MarR family transcriptional regulator